MTFFYCTNFSFVIRLVGVMATPVPVVSQTYTSTLSPQSHTRERTRSCSSRQPGTSTSSTPNSCQHPSFQRMSPIWPQTTTCTRAARWEQQSSFQTPTFSSRPTGREQGGNSAHITVEPAYSDYCLRQIVLWVGQWIFCSCALQAFSLEIKIAKVFFNWIEWLLWQQRATKLALDMVWSKRMPGMPLPATG